MLKFCVPKYLSIWEFQNKFKLPEIFLPSVVVIQNCHSVSLVFLESIKINWGFIVIWADRYYFVNEISCLIRFNEIIYWEGYQLYIKISIICHVSPSIKSKILVLFRYCATKFVDMAVMSISLNSCFCDIFRMILLRYFKCGCINFPNLQKQPASYQHLTLSYIMFGHFTILCMKGLTHFGLFFPFYTFWKHQKTYGFLMFSAVINREHRAVMSYNAPFCSFSISA